MQRFGNLRIAPFDHTHHDGSLERIMLASNLFALKPDQARSMHVGLSGIFAKVIPLKELLKKELSNGES